MLFRSSSVTSDSNVPEELPYDRNITTSDSSNGQYTRVKKKKKITKKAWLKGPKYFGKKKPRGYYYAKQLGMLEFLANNLYLYGEGDFFCNKEDNEDQDQVNGQMNYTDKAKAKDVYDNGALLAHSTPT